MMKLYLILIGFLNLSTKCHVCRIFKSSNIFEQMGDEKKDINPLLKANDQINYFLKKYSNSAYATDLNFKKDLIENQLA